MKTKKQKPIDIAHDWLRKEFEAIHGHMSKWPGTVMEVYHTQLGVLVNFVTDCWPNED